MIVQSHSRHNGFAKSFKCTISHMHTHIASAYVSFCTRFMRIHANKRNRLQAGKQQPEEDEANGNSSFWWRSCWLCIGYCNGGSVWNVGQFAVIQVKWVQPRRPKSHIFVFKYDFFAFEYIDELRTPNTKSRIANSFGIFGLTSANAPKRPCKFIWRY